MQLEGIKNRVKDIQNNNMVIMVDDKSREKQGNLSIIADLVTSKTVNFMAKTMVKLDKNDCRKMNTMWEDARSINNSFTVHKFVIESWKRSRKYNVDPSKQTNNELLTPNQLKKLRKENKKLIEAALPAMHDLYNIAQETGFCIVLADKQGILLERVGSEKAKAFAAQGNFIEGSNWSESVMGTNAVGTVLTTGRPMHIFGYEHYCKCACLCTCSAAPICNERNQIIGILNLTGPYHLMNPHTLAVVRSTAKAIERKFKLIQLYKQSEASNVLRKAIIESMTGYLIVFDVKGNIIQYNEAAGDLLGIDSPDSLNFKKYVHSKNPNFAKLLNSDKAFYGETVSFMTPKGLNKKLIVNVTPLKDESDMEHKGYVVVMNETHNIVNKILKAKTNICFDKLIGESSHFKHAVNQAKIAATSDSNIFLIGESGVGKDLFAQSIHNAGRRSRKTFFAINCAAVPRELLCSELFGYEEGAFTGARKNGNPGKFELADRGTIFLDEIGEAPLDFQASLLRVLEEKSVIRLGGRERIPFDVRIICATNKNIFEEIKNKKFRHDLYYRIGVITIPIPALRERREDIPLLAEYLMKSISQRFGKDVNKIDPKVMDILMNYEWPGNIRELSNVIERAVSMSVSHVISCNVLPFELQQYSSSNDIVMWNETPSKATAEARLIQGYLTKFKNNKTKTARSLRISRSTLYRKIDQYGLTIS